MVEPGQIVLGYPLALELQHSDDALRSLGFAEQSICCFKSNTRKAVEIVAATHDGHSSEVFICPTGERDFSTSTEVLAVDLDAVAILVEFCEQFLGAKDEKIRIVGDDAVNKTLSFEVNKLGVGFIGCNNVRDVEFLELLNEGGCHFGGDVDAFLKFLGCLGGLSSSKKFHGSLFPCFSIFGSRFLGGSLAGEEVTVKDHVRRYTEMTEHANAKHGCIYVPGVCR